MLTTLQADKSFHLISRYVRVVLSFFCFSFIPLGCLFAQSPASAGQQVPPPPPACDAACQAAQKATSEPDAARIRADQSADVARAEAQRTKQATDAANLAAQKAEYQADRAGAATEGANQATAEAKKGTKALYRGLGISGTTRRAKAKNPPLGDFVPCLFDEDQDYDLRMLVKPHRAKDAPIDPAEAQKLTDYVQQTANNLILKPTPTATPQESNEAQRKLQSFSTMLDASKFVGLLPEQVPEEVKNMATTSAVDKSTAKALEAKTAEAVHSLVNPTPFDRPDDVSCSFSVLDWHETSDNFGRRVANDYVAIQVTVRNLNKQNEFLIHDIQIAVDTGLNQAQFGRFRAGRDKLIVRNVSQRGQSEDRRNLILNSLQAIGAIAGGASSAVTQSDGSSGAAQNLASAVAIFQGPFLTGLFNIFPDHTLEHINHINDLGFSASSSSKTVVPIQGAVPLVTFLTEKPLEQLPFSHCGKTVKVKSKKGSDVSDSEDYSKDPGSVHYPFCRADQDEYPALPLDALIYSKPLHYRDWKSAALRILERRIYVVVGGVHIQQLTSNPVVDKLSCPTMGDASIDLSTTDANGNVSCTLNGSHLDKVASIKLKQGTSTNIAGMIGPPAADGNSTPISFKASDFANASGAYELFLTDSSGTDLDSKQTFTFKVRTPSVSQVTYSPNPVQKGKDLIATLIGNNLDRIASVTLVDNAAPTPTTITGTIQHQGSIKASDNTVVVTFASADLQKLKSGGSATLKVTSLDNSNNAQTVNGSTVNLP